MQSNLSGKLVLLTAALGLMRSHAQAQPVTIKPAKASDVAASKSKASKKREATPTRASLPKTKNYNYLADEIDGSRNLPDHTTVFGRPDARHDSLIRLRTDFIAEILRSADVL